MRKIPILIELNNISMLRKKLDNRVKAKDHLKWLMQKDAAR